MRIPKTKFGQFALMFVAQMFIYAVLVANTITYTHYNYPGAAVTELLIGVDSFLFGKLMVECAEVRTWYSGAGLTLGGMFGTLAAMWVSQHLLKV